jgi:hypothetical protein
MAGLETIADFLGKYAAGLGGLIDAVTYGYNFFLVVLGFLTVQLFIFGPIVLFIWAIVKTERWLKESDIIPKMRARLDSL